MVAFTILTTRWRCDLTFEHFLSQFGQIIVSQRVNVPPILSPENINLHTPLHSLSGRSTVRDQTFCTVEDFYVIVFLVNWTNINTFTFSLSWPEQLEPLLSVDRGDLLPPHLRCYINSRSEKKMVMDQCKCHTT